ncbi:LuxR C-terminal-related transcriptional regulator [Denitrobacterium detoxificans]|uniref:Regulatory protein, luxR family n=1 Tax=Denitrobacterium detoxificans TaxID=79604 RepID=A0A1H8RD84_9ACTN|nr:helix-turn-helix transcriptional regulator [Denitrobacterium detoxificans]SEO64322.1 regulatory protein, luxR family [Denitrobacterium detoxificans]
MNNALLKRACTLMGAGPLFAVGLLTVHNASPIVELFGRIAHTGFLACALAGVIIAAVALVAQARSISHAIWKNPQGYIVILSALACSVIGLLFLLAIPAIEIDGRFASVSGLVMGIGCTVLAGAWALTLSQEDSRTAFQASATSVLVGVALYGTSAFLPNQASYALFSASCIFASAAALLPLKPNEGKDDEALAAPDDRVAYVISRTWRPLAGTTLSALVLGLIWNPLYAGIELDTGMLFAASLCGSAAISIVCAVAFAKAGVRAAHVMDRTGLPIAAAIVLLCPYLEQLGGGALFISSSLKEAAFALFLIMTWTSCCKAASTPKSTLRVAGTFLLCATAAMLLGALIIPQIGTAGRILNSIVLIVYLAALAFLNSPVKPQEATDDAKESNEEAEREATPNISASIAQNAERLAKAGALSPRETEVLALLARGHSYAKIAQTLYVSDNTVKTHVRNIYRKLKIESREELFDLIDQQ